MGEIKLCRVCIFFLFSCPLLRHFIILLVKNTFKMSDLIISDYWCCLLPVAATAIVDIVHNTALLAHFIYKYIKFTQPRTPFETTPYTLTYKCWNEQNKKNKKNEMKILAFEFFSANAINNFRTHSTLSQMYLDCNLFLPFVIWPFGFSYSALIEYEYKNRRRQRDEMEKIKKKQKTITKTNSYQLFVIQTFHFIRQSSCVWLDLCFVRNTKRCADDDDRWWQFWWLNYWFFVRTRIVCTTNACMTFSIFTIWRPLRPIYLFRI